MLYFGREVGLQLIKINVEWNKERRCKMIYPMQPKFGIGFTSTDLLSADMVEGYRYEQVGHHHNYHVTKDRWDWPVKLAPSESRIVVDGFSPNLNKELHVGHLRNLALANALQNMMKSQSDTKFVALLGTSLGVKKSALQGWKKWTEFTGYSPEVYYDTALPDDSIKTREPTVVEGGVIDVNEGPDLALPQLWDGPNGPVIVKRADGTPLYAHHDLSFSDWVNPTHYITGHEQREHFASLGFEKKHLSMGLVMGADGKKLKSREGTALSASDAVELVMKNLNERDEKLAWNVLAWNLLQPAREKNVKFESEKWCRPESPGMYISYTYARAYSALGRRVSKAKVECHMTRCRLREYMPVSAATRPNAPTEDDEYEIQPLTELDIRLLGMSEQYLYYFYQAVEKFDPSPVANFAHTLAREIGAAYEKEQIYNGRPAFAATMNHALWRLSHCMKDLGMFPISNV
jgi:arginyl-tRNA synthetase